MTFYGKPESANSEPKPLRTFNVARSATEILTVEASYVQFMPAHVTFWKETEREQDELVLADSNDRILWMEEVPA